MGNAMMYQNPIISEMKIKSANNKRIYINGAIDEDIATEVSYYVNKIIEMDKKIDNPVKEVTFLINSFGGSVVFGNSIIANIIRLKSLNYHTIAIIESCAFSMAFDIICHCDERIGYECSQFLLHQTQMGQDGELKEFEREIVFQKKVWDLSVDYYVKNTKLTRERVNEIYDRKENYFFLSQEALENGSIHKIIK
jgi:ATP-dependent protease ClpP protease subunit